jgi:hypothetical protein
MISSYHQSSPALGVTRNFNFGVKRTCTTGKCPDPHSGGVEKDQVCKVTERTSVPHIHCLVRPTHQYGK